MEENKKPSLFREKSLEAVESPESLNDYLRVTSPGVWLVLSAVIMLLIGAILWGIFGRITTTGTYAVSARESQTVCYVPYGESDAVLNSGTITVNGKDYLLDREAECDVVFISEETDAYVRAAGGLEIGDMTILVPVIAALEDGVYTGSVVTESLRPISLLLQ